MAIFVSSRRGHGEGDGADLEMVEETIKFACVFVFAGEKKTEKLPTSVEENPTTSNNTGVKVEATKPQPNVANGMFDQKKRIKWWSTNENIS